MEFQKFVTDFLSKMQDEDPASAFTKEGQALTDLSRQQDLDTREADLEEEQPEVTDVEELTGENLSSLTPKSEPAMDSASFETSIPEPASVPEAEGQAPEIFTGDQAEIKEPNLTEDSGPAIDSSAFDAAVSETELGADAEASIPEVFAGADADASTPEVFAGTEAEASTPEAFTGPEAEVAVPEAFTGVKADVEVVTQESGPEAQVSVSERSTGTEAEASIPEVFAGTEAEAATPEVFTGPEAEAAIPEAFTGVKADVEVVTQESGPEAQVSETSRASTEPAVPSLFLSEGQPLPVDAVSATTSPGPEAVPNKQPEVPEALRPFFNDMITQAESQFPEGIDNLEIREPGIELPPLPSIPEDIFVDNARIHMVSGDIMQRDRR